MKIFNVLQIREADTATIARQGITSLELMERAANEAFLWIRNKFYERNTTIHVICGRGNNGGDGLVIARLLHMDGYNVIVNCIDGAGKPSEDFTRSLEKLKEHDILYTTALTPIDSNSIVIDAIFGTGISRNPEGEVKEAIERINAAGAIVISVDVPSGLFPDKTSSLAVKSDVVLTFQFSKLAFYLPSNRAYLTYIAIIDIGLDDEYIRETPTDTYLIDAHEARFMVKPVPFYAHKGTQGHALIIGGSHGKIGAACLSARAALKSGCGLVTAYLPECGYTVIQSSFPEAMALTGGDRHITKIEFEIQPKAIGIGPGLGMHKETVLAFGDFLKQNKTQLVIDADALNILSENTEWLDLLPEDSILTPHPLELQRLIGQWDDDFDRLEKVKAFSKKYKLIIVAKDADTMVFHNDSIYINSTGNAGLATGGSGDVLTGIITGLLAQSYSPVNAAICAVYLHGLSADIGVEKTGRHSFIASDIITYLGAAYLKTDL